MSPWIKICGNTSLDDARIAADAGADAVGFVFAPSPRKVSAAQVKAIVSGLPASLEKIGVFVDASFEDLRATVRETELTGVQLHCATSQEMPARLRAEFGPALRILRVVHFGPDAATLAQSLAADPNVDATLVDSRTETAVGGTGTVFDWQAAREILFRNAVQRRLVVAGGLNPSNVAGAIQILRPWGVDVVSGVEAAPGRKDPAKVSEFIANARSADRK
ncbi:MAG TPA: phosphoribosylanthranilate isomerase [Terracidiphilus sp.]|nr:phosphoribosylanthranilate isomerase [Terracidiphilus sp.]